MAGQEDADVAARSAISDGRSILVWTAKADDVAAQIEAIEAAGWRLDQFSTALSPSLAKVLLATCVFRRL
jgi:hypothetical protein